VEDFGYTGVPGFTIVEGEVERETVGGIVTGGGVGILLEEEVEEGGDEGGV